MRVCPRGRDPELLIRFFGAKKIRVLPVILFCLMTGKPRIPRLKDLRIFQYSESIFLLKMGLR